MKILNKISLKRKMNFVIISVTLITVVLGFLFIGFSTTNIYKKNLKYRSILNARLIGEFALIPLTYEETDRAKRTLNKLKLIPDIENCLIFDEFDSLFVSYSKNRNKFVSTKHVFSDTVFFENSYLHVYQPIIFQTIRYGTVYLRVSTAEIQAEINRSIRNLVLMLFLLLILSLLISNYFQDFITKPIFNLVKITNKLILDADYSIRIKPQTNDEIGELYRSFNELLINLEERNKENEAQKQLLRNQQEQLQAIIDAIPHLIYIKDRQGKYLLVNREFCTVFNLPENEIIGKSQDELKNEISLVETEEELISVIELEESQFVPTAKITDFMDMELYLQLTKIPFKFYQQETLLGIGIDISSLLKTEQALRASQELFSKFMDVLPAAVFIKDEKGRYLFVNQYLIRNFNADTWINKFIVLNEEHDVKRVIKEDQKALKGAYSFEEKLRDKHGNIRYFETWKFPVERFDKNKLIGGISIEITHKKRAEEKVNFYIRELKRNNKELSEFNYVASHDLREPLRTLTSYCELLKEDVGENLNEDAKEDIEFIINAAARMNNLIQDLLDLSRAGRLELKKNKLNLNKIIQSIKIDLKQYIEEKNAVLIVDELPDVYGDETSIRRVLQNLIHNAIKFNESQQPEVKIFSMESPSGIVKIVVEDNGIGIEKEFQEEIFAPFKRLHPKSKYEGTGIGLAICKKIVERHGGNFEIRSEKGKGSSFLFSLNIKSN